MGLFNKKTKDKKRQPQLLAGQDDYTFRRSRTLTGTTSNQIAASAQARSQLKTPRLKAHELRQQRSKVLKMLLALGFMAVILTWVIANYIGSFALQYPQSGATATAVTAQYQKTLQQYFNEHPFERFGFTLNTNQLKTYISSKHAEVNSIVVARQWYGGVVDFAIYFRKPILVWQSGQQRFYVDDQGTAFGYDHFNSKLVAVTDKSGISPGATSNSVASQRFIRFLGKMVGAVSNGQKGNVTEVVIPTSTREIDLKLEGREYLIRTHIDRDPLQQAEDAVNALAYFDVHGIKPQYIDVRVSGKAFYK